VILLRVVEPIPAVTAVGGVTSVFVQRVINQQTNEAKSYLAGWQGEFRKKGIKARVQIVVGSVVRAIMDIAARENVDLIAMVSHDQGPAASIF
jgi:nucleotide-binding universal stress UspA family protein